jgi:hypothetical protein
MFAQEGHRVDAPSELQPRPPESIGPRDLQQAPFREFNQPVLENVLGNTRSAKRSISQDALLHLPRGCVRNNNHDVVVAIQAGMSPGHGTEEVDVLRSVCFHETAHNLTRDRVAGRWDPQAVGIPDRHSQPSPACQRSPKSRRFRPRGVQSETPPRERHSGGRRAGSGAGRASRPAASPATWPAPDTAEPTCAP